MPPNPRPVDEIRPSVDMTIMTASSSLNQAHSIACRSPWILSMFASHTLATCQAATSEVTERGNGHS
jgi:hypothetical protein